MYLGFALFLASLFLSVPEILQSLLPLQPESQAPKVPSVSNDHIASARLLLLLIRPRPLHTSPLFCF